MSKRQQKKELPIYDPEGVDPQANISYEEVKVPIQEQITATRRSIYRSWISIREAWARVTGDTRDNLTDVAGKARRQTNSTLSSLGVGDSGQVLQGSAYAGAVIAGLYLARRRSMFFKMFYPILGVGLVGGALHRHKLYTEYEKIMTGGHQGNWLPWPQKKHEKRSTSNLETSIRQSERENGRKED